MVAWRSAISLGCSVSRLLTQHNQEIAQWSPDPFSCERVGSGQETKEKHYWAGYLTTVGWSDVQTKMHFWMSGVSACTKTRKHFCTCAYPQFVASARGCLLGTIRFDMFQTSSIEYMLLSTRAAVEGLYDNLPVIVIWQHMTINHM